MTKSNVPECAHDCIFVMLLVLCVDEYRVLVVVSRLPDHSPGTAGTAGAATRVGR